jgi:hypothetical protein
VSIPPREVVCPGCHGKGFRRTERGGEAEDCPVCDGEMFVDGFACESPELAWVKDQREQAS